VGDRIDIAEQLAAAEAAVRDLTEQLNQQRTRAEAAEGPTVSDTRHWMRGLGLSHQPVRLAWDRASDMWGDYGVDIDTKEAAKWVDSCEVDDSTFVYRLWREVAGTGPFVEVTVRMSWDADHDGERYVDCSSCIGFTLTYHKGAVDG